MAWHRTLVSILSLVAFVVTLCVPADAVHAAPGRAVVPVVATGEPCPGTSGVRRCDVKLLPVTLAASGPQPGVASAFHADEDGDAPGVWPEVEPDPPRPHA